MLTWISHRDPLVELILVRNGVKLTAQHLSKGGLILLALLCVTSAIALPFPCTVLSSKLRSVGNSGKTSSSL